MEESYCRTDIVETEEVSVCQRCSLLPREGQYHTCQGNDRTVAPAAQQANFIVSDIRMDYFTFSV